MSSCLRKGVTFFEILVVILIIGVLGSLLLAAVQAVRTAALRTQCANNLRQIGLGLHHYHENCNLFPPGVGHPPVYWEKNKDSYPLLNWHGRLLPYLEQEALWRVIQEAYAKDRLSLKIPPHVGALVHLRLFTCPGESPILIPGVPLEKTQGATSYLGISGINRFRMDGVFFTDSQIRVTDIQDGTSNTILVGERPPSRDLFFGRWYGGWGPWGMANAFLGVRETDVADRFYNCLPGPYRFEKGSMDDPCSIYHFWSFHPGGANFLFVDGSVKFLSYSAESILPALATRAGGETVNTPD